MLHSVIKVLVYRWNGEHAAMSVSGFPTNFFELFNFTLTLYFSYIHPFIHYLYPPILGRVTGGAGAYPSVHWAKGRITPWTGCQSIAGIISDTFLGNLIN
uniref:Uncharacterized protein n=1 Tax=Anguilla anguilla TaxID=7936 RepID=A0A0E9X1J8_ANGAN